ncbi:MDR family MFS transporter [Peribacillus kribbensis]|uniref:MDR family MFS transporter n=1 Tax=Peribacillus kribbensis TaxID=356658 RepID=UPI0004242951|nr:MFS transporter [Peribacillus kribbensis]
MRFREFHRNIKIRIAETFLSRFAGGMIFPFMTIYLASHFGARTAGLLLLINVGAGIAVSFIGGYLSDTYGRKKIMAGAETARLAAYIIMLISNSPLYQAPLITFFMMTVNSISWGLSGPANQAMLIDVSTPEQRRLMYSVTYWANNLSIAIGGILGGFLFKDYLFELFMALVLLEIAVVWMVIFLMEESHAGSVRKIAPAEHIFQLIASYKTVVKDHLFIRFVLAGVLISSMEFQLTNYTGIRLSNVMESQYFFSWKIDGLAMMGFLRSENTILVVIMVLFASKWSSIFNDKTTLIISCFLFTIGYGVLSYSTDIWVLVLFMVILTIGEVFRVPVEQSYTASIPPENARSAYMAVKGLNYNLAMLIASLTVTLGSFVPPLFMTVLITSAGLIGILIYSKIIPGLEDRKTHMEAGKSM